LCRANPYTERATDGCEEESVNAQVWRSCQQERRACDAQEESRHPEERRKHPKVKSREQAIAIGLSEARAKGAKVPRKKSAATKK
jgi:Family of unknown function (DUF6496)